MVPCRLDEGVCFPSAILLPGMWIKVLALWPPSWVMRMNATAGEEEAKLAGAWTLEGQVRLRVMGSHRQVLQGAGRPSDLYFSEERCVQHGPGSQMEAGSPSGAR